MLVFLIILASFGYIAAWMVTARLLLKLVCGGVNIDGVDLFMASWLGFLLTPALPLLLLVWVFKNFLTMQSTPTHLTLKRKVKKLSTYKDSREELQRRTAELEEWHRNYEREHVL